ncbi:flagellar filament capping protein FliD [Neobacillus sp. NPDC058068]|uniref:flagellar filament capping protein FliD n=1 Tax=Neobacillus sp. NPDC058068 TaxID=3346325 RepID=UPI0036D993FD
MSNSSITRITGMATGLDTDTIVKKLMNVEKIPLDKLIQKQQKQMWLSDAFRQWNKDLFSFNTNTLFNMKLSSAYNTFDVSSSQSNSVSGTGTSSAVPGTYTVKVNNVAESATFTGKDVQLKPAQTLSEAGQLADKTTIKIKVYNNPNDSSAFQFADIAIDPDDTINNVVSKINSSTDASGKSLGLQAIYDANLKQFIVRSKATGENIKVEISDDGTTESQNLLNNTLKIGTGSQNGKDADISFNGNQVKTASNNVVIMGISLSLKSPTLDSNGVPITSTITVSQNIDTEVKNIKDFIDKYNDLLDKLNKANDEPVYKDFLPLTDDQRSEMSEKQIEQWEAKAKSGLLHGDSIIKDIVNKMRNVMNSIVGNGSTYNSLLALGISSKGYQDKGKLYVDETKLRAAIQADPDGVRNLFSQIGDNEKGTNGLVHRLSETMTQGINDLTKKAGLTGGSQYDQSVIGKLLSNIQKDITRQNDRLNKAENQYYKQFAAMEAAVNKFNSQGSWLYSQFNSGQ